MSGGFEDWLRVEGYCSWKTWLGWAWLYRSRKRSRKRNWETRLIKDKSRSHPDSGISAYEWAVQFAERTCGIQQKLRRPVINGGRTLDTSNAYDRDDVLRIAGGRALTVREEKGPGQLQLRMSLLGFEDLGIIRILDGYDPRTLNGMSVRSGWKDNFQHLCHNSFTC